MNNKITIRDVARHANVSVASVSYVLNGIEKVSAETKARILQSIDVLDYRPSLTAQCLSKGESRLIGIMLPITEKGDRPGMLLGSNPFFGEFISGIEYVTRSKGYDILISGMHTDEQCRDWIMRRKLDGIILLGMYPRSYYEELGKLGIPIVLTDAYEEYAAGFHRVMVEDYEGGYLATRHLLELGHRTIAFASGSIEHSCINERRYSGYLKAMQEAGLATSSALLYEDHVSFHGGYRIGERILQTGRGISAVFAAADIVALGLIKAFSANGKKVPEDFSVVGFDDIEVSRYTTPELTTIRQDIARKGSVAAEMIVADVAAGHRTGTCVTLQPELVIRGSSARFTK